MCFKVTQEELNVSDEWTESGRMRSSNCHQLTCHKVRYSQPWCGQTDLVHEEVSASVEMLQSSSWVSEGAITQLAVVADDGALVCHQRLYVLHTCVHSAPYNVVHNVLIPSQLTRQTAS